MATLRGVVGVSERRVPAPDRGGLRPLPDDLEIPPVKVPPARVLAASVLPVAAHVLRRGRAGTRRCWTPIWPPTRSSATAAGPRSPRSTTGPELAGLWRMRIEPEFHRVSWMLSAATRSSGASFVTTRKRLQRWSATPRPTRSPPGWARRPGQLASLGLLDGSGAAGPGRDRPGTFNRRYGHRGPHEFEISTPRPAEDPDWIDRQLAAQAGTERSGYRRCCAGQEERQRDAWARIAGRPSAAGRRFLRRLDRWAKIARDREHARTEVIRYFWVLRLTRSGPAS